MHFHRGERATARTEDEGVRVERANAESAESGQDSVSVGTAARAPIVRPSARRSGGGSRRRARGPSWSGLTAVDSTCAERGRFHDPSRGRATGDRKPHRRASPIASISQHRLQLWVDSMRGVHNGANVIHEPCLNLDRRVLRGLLACPPHSNTLPFAAPLVADVQPPKSARPRSDSDSRITEVT